METTTALDTRETKLKSTEWTDEKHSLYLKGMEATFVNQLYASTDFMGQHQHSLKENSSYPKWSRQNCCNTYTTSGQFKVFQGGSWKKVRYGRANLQPNKEDDSHHLVASPWIKHFRPSCKHQTVADQTVQEPAESMNWSSKSRGNAFSCELATTSSKQLHSNHSNWCDQELEGSENEVSDQNFVGEYIEGEKASSSCSLKRLKRLTIDQADSSS